LASARGATDRVFISEALLLCLRVERRAARRRAAEREQTIHKALVAANDALRFEINGVANVWVCCVCVRVANQLAFAWARARANVLAMQSDVTDDVFNVASGTETSLADLARALLAAMDSDLPLEYGPSRAVNGVTRRLASTDAAAADLGFRAEIDLQTGLRELGAWWRAEQLPAADLVTVPAGAGA